MSAKELRWFRSSYSSSGEPGDCVEVASEWFKSSYSDSSDINDCVEIAKAPAAIHVRDSKNAAGPRLTLSPAAWASFVAPLSSAR
ncbi:DUF397 domain-containing protein [Streptomyces sp. NPDC087844]|uniref:DUF397 domain-containing protein n=1 Tax=Streptomyces sp. NPDC087844 TaxID=3365805 RepID=UPI003819FADA